MACQLLDMEYGKVHGHINQWKIIMIIYTAIQKFTSKVCTDYFVDANLHPYHCLSIYDWTNNIELGVRMGETP